MNQENFWILFSRKIAGEASPEELAELEQMMLQHPEWQFAANNLEQLWQPKAAMDRQQEEDAFLLHVNRLKEKGIDLESTDDSDLQQFELRVYARRKRLRNISIMTAIAASLFLVFFLFFQNDRQPSSSTIANRPQEVSTRLGSKSKIQLPDGSTVWLNAGSRITYDKFFGVDTRELMLSGEAFFDVVEDKEKPFVIHASNINIKVLGTAFNVKAYPEDKRSETSLIRGRIEVSFRNRPNDKIILSPNEKLVVDNDMNPLKDSISSKNTSPVVAINKLKVNPADSTIVETGWVENRLVFENESLNEVAIKMERWYGVEIEIADPLLEEKRFTGKFVDESIEQAMDALIFSYPFRFERTGNKITIKR